MPVPDDPEESAMARNDAVHEQVTDTGGEFGSRWLCTPVGRAVQPVLCLTGEPAHGRDDRVHP
jgi:hypothetical protein